MGSIGEIIRNIRDLKDLKQKDIYIDFCSRREISRIEKGESFPSLIMAEHICKVLDVSIDRLLLLSQLKKHELEIFEKISCMVESYDFKDYEYYFFKLKNMINVADLSIEFYFYYNLYTSIYYLLKKEENVFNELIELCLSILEESKILINTKICLEFLIKFLKKDNLVIEFNSINFKYKFNYLRSEQKIFIYCIVILYSFSNKFSENIDEVLIDYRKIAIQLGDIKSILLLQVVCDYENNEELNQLCKCLANTFF